MYQVEETGAVAMAVVVTVAAVVVQTAVVEG